MSGQQGTPTLTASQSPSVFQTQQQSPSMASPAVMPPQQPSMGGGKGAGPMQPQRTAMGTPITYGNVYSQAGSPSSNSITSKITSAPEVLEAADGTTSVPGYANGTEEVDDPWNWSKKEQVAPLAVTIKPSQDVAPAPLVVKDPTEQFLGQQALGMGTNAAAKGIDAAYKAYNAPLTTQAVSSLGTTASGAPVALTNAGALSAPASTSMYALSAPASIGGAGTGIAAGSAAPIGSSIGAGLIGGAEGAALATGASTAATGATAASALGAGGSAMMTALSATPALPIVAGLFAAKKLGIFG